MTKRSNAAAYKREPLLRVALLCFLLLASIAGSSCGKVGAPVPPARITARTADLSAIQRGGAIVLSWPPPPLIQTESSPDFIARAEIYRLVERRDEEPFLDPDDFEELAEVIGIIDRDSIQSQAESPGVIQFSDNITPSPELSRLRLRYAVRYINRRGQMGRFSNTAAVEPEPVVAMPPTDLELTGEAQDELTLTWQPPQSNIDTTSPALVAGYNVYRRTSRRGRPRRPLNSEPLVATTFTDRGFDYERTYYYTVRSLTPGPGGLIESSDSGDLEVTPADTFPPDPPDPVSIASAGGVISLFWPTSPESDVIGYLVYRSDTGDLDGEWVRLTDNPLTTVTFRDDSVELGGRYYYRVTAVDVFGNESDPSSTVSETANP